MRKCNVRQPWRISFCEYNAIRALEGIFRELPPPPSICVCPNCRRYKLYFSKSWNAKLQIWCYPGSWGYIQSALPSPCQLLLPSLHMSICHFCILSIYVSTVTCVYGVMHVYFCGYLSLGYHHACVYFMEWGFPSRTHPSLCDSCDKYPNLVTGKEELCANNASNWIYSSGRQKA